MALSHIINGGLLLASKKIKLKLNKILIAANPTNMLKF